MSAAPEIKGWCPGALRPMMSGDGLVVRVRPAAGRVTAEQAQGIADLAERFGNSLIDLSARANLQLRGVAEAAYPALIDGLFALGLIDPSAEVEARRNIIVSPLWTEGDGTVALAKALATALAADDAPALPGKFGFAVDCGPAPRLRDISADIRLERLADGGLVLLADGAAEGMRVTPAQAAEEALALARWFLASGGARESRGRMRGHIGAGHLPPVRFRGTAAPAQGAARPEPGPSPQGWLVGFEFGQIAAKTVSKLAEIGSFRVTPWRMLLIENAANAPDLPGVITQPLDPRLRVTACTGAPGCLQGLGQTRDLARALAPAIPLGSHLHVSGCAKGCAHPGPAALTLVARAGGRFDLICKGRAADQPVLSGLTPAELIQNPDILSEKSNAP
ncbi:MAG: precorrin-3B synthase [Paracoccaceae bacterium]